jgi:hypothetical protein
MLTAQDDEAAEFDDHELIDRATELGRVLFDDLLREANWIRRAAQSSRHSVTYSRTALVSGR